MEPYWDIIFNNITRRDENCTCAVVSPSRFFQYHISDRCSELVTTVQRGDLVALEKFLTTDESVQIYDRYGNSPLHISIIVNRIDVFDYLMTLEHVNVNALNRYDQTPIFLALVNNSEYFLTRLIRKGGDVNLGNATSCSPLHTAAAQDSPKHIEILLENGADINARNKLGRTPLFHACQLGNIDSVYALLYYGAPVTVTDDDGMLPLAAAMQKFTHRCEVRKPDLECHEILFNYTFDDHTTSIHLNNLTVAMRMESPLFPEILKKVDRLKYTQNELTYLAKNAFWFKGTQFKLFMGRFGYIVREIIRYPAIVHCGMSSRKNEDRKFRRLMNFMTMLFEFDSNFNFLKGALEYKFLIPYVIILYNNGKFSMSMLNDTIFFLYSYGLPCELVHLILIYRACGFCDIVKLMLDLEILESFEHPQAIIPYLLYDVHLTIDKLLESIDAPHAKFKAALNFFSTQKVRNFFARSPDFREQVAQLPTVPSLVESSREVARKHIIDVFKIEKSRDFYRLIRRMPISNVYKQILTYEKELYRFA